MSVNVDPWNALKKMTHARIALGRAGHSVSTSELLDFRLAHAKARDSVWREADFDAVQSELGTKSLIRVQSQCASKQEYLLNPALGRALSQASIDLLNPPASEESMDCCLVIADGLSANAVHTGAALFARQFIATLDKQRITLGPVILARYARVALGDQIGALMRSRSVLILIGERPGLASSESLSAYFTYGPEIGKTDAYRNCISNIHSSGLPMTAAADMAAFLTETAIQRKLSGVDLKVEFPAIKTVT